MTNKLMSLFLCIISVLTTTNSYANDDHPVLTIRSSSYRLLLTRNQLENMTSIVKISMNNNRAYPNIRMTYNAVKLCDLFKPFTMRSSDTLEFIAADKFSVLIPAKYIMHCDKNSAIGYLAIEPASKWPLLKNNTGTTAGPFDVIWLHPEKSYISDEYWAWSVVEIVIHQKLDASLVPDAPNVKNAKLCNHLKNGYNKYISHCAGCHTINHIGKATIGPDLNIPKNPIEYYPDEKVLKKFIRDPQSVRIKKHDRMSGSSKQFLSDYDLDDLLLYFHYMAKHKINLDKTLKK